MALDEQEQQELDRLEAAFDEVGGRDVELAEQLDRLRLKRDGVDVLVRIELSELIHMDSEAFDEAVEEAVAAEHGGGGGSISAWTAEVEDVENNTSLVIRVQGDWE